MTDTQFDNAMTTAVRAREARDTVKGLWGSRYAEKSAPWRDLIRRGVANAKCSPLQVPLIMQKNARAAGNELEPMALLMLIAASVDEVEGVAHAQAQAG